MVEKKTKFVSRKTKQAADLANKAGQGVASAWKDLNTKGREGIHRAYLSKKQYAVAKILEIKTEYPGIDPQETQAILDAELSTVEAKKGPLSVTYTRAASMYFISSMEVRQMDPQSSDTTKALFSLLLILDSRAVKGIRYIAKAAAFLVPLIKGAKAAKPSGAAIKGAKATAKANAARKAVKLIKAQALPTGKQVLKNAINSGRVTQYIIGQTHKIIGPAPSSWKTEEKKDRATKKVANPSKQ